jgi:hypothetical protein
MADTADLAERHRSDASLKHALAMEAIGLIRTALHLQRPVFDALISAQTNSNDLIDRLPPAGRESFDLQVRMATAAIDFMHELDALADVAIELAHRRRKEDG